MGWPPKAGLSFSLLTKRFSRMESKEEAKKTNHRTFFSPWYVLFGVIVAGLATASMFGAEMLTIQVAHLASTPSLLLSNHTTTIKETRLHKEAFIVTILGQLIPLVCTS